VTKKYITVVFEYVKGAMLPQELIEAFISNRKYKDTVITAVSLESDIEHVEKQNNLILKLCNMRVGNDSCIKQPDTHNVLNSCLN